jgi:hypothetical protein
MAGCLLLDNLSLVEVRCNCSFYFTWLISGALSPSELPLVSSLILFLNLLNLLTLINLVLEPLCACFVLMSW